MNAFTRMFASPLGFALLATAGAAAAGPKNVFVSAMTPSQELAGPVLSGEFTPSCLATFELIERGRVLGYRIRCYRMTGITAAHVHGPASADAEASPLVALFGHAGTDNVNGELTRGRIVRGTDLEDADFDALIEAMRNDNAYVNVHTTINATGEVRGQVAGLALPPQFVIDVF